MYVEILLGNKKWVLLDVFGCPKSIWIIVYLYAVKGFLIVVEILSNPVNGAVSSIQLFTLLFDIGPQIFHNGLAMQREP